jgi:transcriptional regulator with XRE-family HTH domain
MNNFGNLIASRRKELKMTQKELALKLNVSDKTISKWETGTSYPEVTMLSEIAKALDMNVGDFFAVEDLQAKNTSEPEVYDESIINKYKNKIFLAIGLIIGGFIFLLASAAIENESYLVILVTFALLSITSGLIFFTSTNINFRSLYSTKYYTQKYDKIYFIYSSVTLILFTLPFVFYSLFTHKSPDFSTISGIMFYFSFLVIAVSYFTITRIAKSANFKIKKDLTNLILSVATIIYVILLAADIIPLPFISVLFILIYIIIFRRKYVKSE